MGSEWYGCPNSGQSAASLEGITAGKKPRVTQVGERAKQTEVNIGTRQEAEKTDDTLDL